MADKVEPRVFYVSENGLVYWLNDLGWTRTGLIEKAGDRVVVGEKEYEVCEDLSRRPLNRGEKRYWDGTIPGLEFEDGTAKMSSPLSAHAPYKFRSERPLHKR